MGDYQIKRWRSKKTRKERLEETMTEKNIKEDEQFHRKPWYIKIS